MKNLENRLVTNTHVQMSIFWLFYFNFYIHDRISISNVQFMLFDKGSTVILFVHKYFF